MTALTQLYVARMGMISPLGATSIATAAAVNAGLSAYSLSNYNNEAGEPITLAEVPDALFDEMQLEIEESDVYCAQYDRIIKMAILAAQQACNGLAPATSIPLILAMPEPDVPTVHHGLLTRNLAQHVTPYINPAITRSIFSGRAAGIEAIEFAFRYLHQTHPYMLIGGSDSHRNYGRLRVLDKNSRLLSPGSSDSFAPGEGACFLLLTPFIELAEVRGNHIVAVHQPCIADEVGHLYSQEPYRGDGLDKAFKQVLANQLDKPIQTIYSSMNGENYWAKEYGVAYIRNKTKFADSVKIEHPADCYGDLGAATAPALIAMAVESLHKNKHTFKHLVYSSSDGAKRGAVIVEKIRIN